MGALGVERVGPRYMPGAQRRRRAPERLVRGRTPASP